MIRIFAVLICMTLMAPRLSAQVRGGVYVAQPGNMYGAGSSSSYNVSTFISSSYGLGSFQGGGGGGGSDILRSSIYGGGALGGSRTGSAGGLTSGLSNMIASPSLFTSRGGGSPVVGTVESGGGGLKSALQASAERGSFYLKALGVFDEDLKHQDKPITSFVPDEPSMYQSYMQRGETSFRDGDYRGAADQFILANRIGTRDWTSLLSLAHCYFALQSFHTSAHYLRQAVKYFPEMPLVSIEPREFFGNQTRYADSIIKLEQFAQEDREDSDGLLLLAYFRWFDNNPAAAKAALSQVLASAARTAPLPEDTPSVETARIFWKAMARSGKVSGSLEDAANPSTSTAPASEPVPPSVKSP